MIKFAKERECVTALMEAMKSGDENAQREAWQSFHDSITATIMADVEDVKASQDATILASRGYRQLTTAETAWYSKVIDAMKSKNPKQAFVDILGDEEAIGVMPSTIIEDVYKDLAEEHPIIGTVNFQYVGYLTKWILNDHTKQKAVWGEITDAIVKEITSAFKVVNTNQYKLSAYAIIEKGMLELGPIFLDAYLRACLKEALACGLEDAIVNGTGIEQPIGLIRNLASYDVSTGFAEKAAEAVTDFTPASYGALVAKLAETEGGKARKIGGLCLAVNQQDYLTKIMPATTVLNNSGAYVNNLFPVPTKVVICNAVADNRAVLYLGNEYTVFAGGAKDGVIEYSDDAKFIEDQRVFKIKQYANGRPFDNNCAVYLDISNLDPAYITVKNVEVATV